MLKYSQFSFLVLFTYNQLIKARVHLGSMLNIWTIYSYFLVRGMREGYFILNLNLTVFQTRKAMIYLEYVISKGLGALFCSQNLLLEQRIYSEFRVLRKHGLSFTHKRWLGGILTNFKLFRRNVFGNFRLKAFNIKTPTPTLRNKWLKTLNSVVGYYKTKLLPSFIFVSNIMTNPWALNEGKILMIPTAAMVDTDVININIASYPIPANEESKTSVLLFLVIFKNSFYVGLMRRRKRFLLALNIILHLLRKRNKLNLLNFFLYFTAFVLKLVYRVENWTKLRIKRIKLLRVRKKKLRLKKKQGRKIIKKEKSKRSIKLRTGKLVVKSKKTNKKFSRKKLMKNKVLK